MNREEVLEILQSHVRRGAVTTYRELSLFFYGDTQGTRAVGSALRALVAHDPDMTAWTNRVVASNGAAAVPGQLAQLADEQVPIRNGRVRIDQANLVRHQDLATDWDDD